MTEVGRVELDRLATSVLASLDGMPAAAVSQLAVALRLAGGPLGRFAYPFESLATDFEYREVEPGLLSRARMKRALRLAARLEADELLGLLDGVEVQPWATIRAAVLELREASLDGGAV